MKKCMNNAMGGCLRFWTGYSDQRLLANEKRLLFKWGGLDPSRTQITQTQVSPDPEDTIHAISVRNKVKC